jgi:hypothetical protein
MRTCLIGKPCITSCSHPVAVVLALFLAGGHRHYQKQCIRSARWDSDPHTQGLKVPRSAVELRAGSLAETRTLSVALKERRLTYRLRGQDVLWAGSESNTYSQRRLLYRQRDSPPVQPTQAGVCLHPDAVRLTSFDAPASAYAPESQYGLTDSNCYLSVRSATCRIHYNKAAFGSVLN